MKNKIFMLLDRSGSMSGMWDETINSINNYIGAIEDRNTEVLLAAFSNNYDVLFNGPVRNWEPLNSGKFSPFGGTVLVDSAVRIIHSMINSKADRAVLVVMTDGEENSSKKYSSLELQSLVKLITDERTFNYDVVFLGANFDGISTVAAKNFGNMDLTRSINVGMGNMNMALGATSSATQSYFSSGVKNKSFYSDEIIHRAASTVTNPK